MVSEPVAWRQALGNPVKGFAVNHIMRWMLAMQQRMSYEKRLLNTRERS